MVYRPQYRKIIAARGRTHQPFSKTILYLFPEKFVILNVSQRLIG